MYQALNALTYGQKGFQCLCYSWKYFIRLKLLDLEKTVTTGNGKSHAKQLLETMKGWRNHTIQSWKQPSYHIFCFFCSIRWSLKGIQKYVFKQEILQILTILKKDFCTVSNLTFSYLGREPNKKKQVCDTLIYWKEPMKVMKQI